MCPAHKLPPKCKTKLCQSPTGFVFFLFFFGFFSSSLYSQSFTFFSRTVWSHVSVWWSDKWSIFEMMNLQEHNSSTVAVSCVLVYLTVKDYGVWSYHFMANRRGKSGSNDRFCFQGLQKSLQMVTAVMKLKEVLLLGRKAMTNLDSILKSRDIPLPTKVHIVKAMAFQ